MQTRKKDKKILYLGLDPTRYAHQDSLVHLPLIKIIPINSKEITNAFTRFSLFTHLLFTSRNAVSIFCDLCKQNAITLEMIRAKSVIAVGKATASLLVENQLTVSHVAVPENAEGIVQILEKLDLKNSHFFFPHSSLSRPLLCDYFTEKKVLFTDCVIYHTEFCRPADLPDLMQFNEIVFTSPSTVDAFLECYKEFPLHAKLTPIGSITEKKIISKKNELSYRYSKS